MPDSSATSQSTWMILFLAAAFIEVKLTGRTIGVMRIALGPNSEVLLVASVAVPVILSPTTTPLAIN